MKRTRPVTHHIGSPFREPWEDELRPDDLKNCPFCGAKAKACQNADDKWLIDSNHKKDCYLEGMFDMDWYPFWETESEAINCWNRRDKL